MPFRQRFVELLQFFELIFLKTSSHRSLYVSKNKSNLNLKNKEKIDYNTLKINYNKLEHSLSVL